MVGVGRYYGAMSTTTMPMPSAPITGPSAWRGADLKHSTECRGGVVVPDARLTVPL